MFRLRERRLAANASTEPPLTDNGIPVPPPMLRVLVAGHADPSIFLEQGRAVNQILRDSVADAGRPVTEMTAILDWGCGCGRVARFWSDLDEVSVHGCDANREMVNWIEQHISFVRARTNGRVPPLPYPNESFDFVYALSVFTHLPNHAASAWMSEMLRVLRPGGLFFFTTHGTSYLEQLGDKDAAAFERGEAVVVYPYGEGTTLCGAYHPRVFVEHELAKDFELIQAVETHTLSRERWRDLPQDRYLVRKPEN
jgi:SAM-dependent methyltransferase